MPSPFWGAAPPLAVFYKATKIFLNKPLEQVLQENGKEAVEEISNIIRYYKMKNELNQRNELGSIQFNFK
jgi:hypothetical protein